jgi:hypothetical protein
MRKVCALLLAMALGLLLGGCAGTDYRRAGELYAAGEVDAALAAYEALGDYKDSAAQAVHIRYDLGTAAMAAEDWETAAAYFRDLHYNDSESLLEKCEGAPVAAAVEDFLDALEPLVAERLKGTTAQQAELRAILETERAALAPYRDLEAAQPYLAALELQLATLDDIVDHSYQLQWQRGRLLRRDALLRLRQDYGFMAEDAAFEAGIAAGIDELRAYVAALEAINRDIRAQLDAREGFAVIDSSRAELTLKNNTAWRFSAEFILQMFRAEDTQFIKESTVPMTAIDPGESYDLMAAIGGTIKVESVHVDWWITEVDTDGARS